MIAGWPLLAAGEASVAERVVVASSVGSVSAGALVADARRREIVDEDRTRAADDLVRAPLQPQTTLSPSFASPW